jgi:mercuric reductase
MVKQYDIVIIGRGAAAFSAAIKASELSDGKVSIAMVGNGPLGGTCVNVGCVPSKYLIESASKYYYSFKKTFPGIQSSKPSLDFNGLMKGLHGLVQTLRKEKYEKVINAYSNVDTFEGTANFVSAKEIEVNKSLRIGGRGFLVAVGSSPSAPPIEGLSDIGYLDSNNVWDLKYIPKSIVVLGGGAIGLELGQAFLHLGSEVSVVEAAPNILPPAELDISEMLRAHLEEEGMSIITKARVVRVFQKNGRKSVEIVGSAGKKVLETEEILVATGRKPNTSTLNLDKAHVNTDSKGFIITDERMRTSNPSIYAAGDCISKKLMLETLVAKEGTVAVSNILGRDESIDYSSAPWAVFTTPQVASVGYKEEEFMKLNGSCSCRVLSLEDVPKAGIIGESIGLTKIVINPSNGKVVGVHILSPYATEIIMEGVYAVKLGLTYEDIIGTTHVFPTLAESLKMASQAFLRDVSMMSCCVE